MQNQTKKRNALPSLPTVILLAIFVPGIFAAPFWVLLAMPFGLSDLAADLPEMASALILIGAVLLSGWLWLRAIPWLWFRYAGAAATNNAFTWVSKALYGLAGGVFVLAAAVAVFVVVVPA